MVVIYALMILVWFSSWWQRRWWLVGVFVLTLLILPLTYQQLTRVQVTVLATQQEPVVVIQDQGKVALINSGDADTVTYTILPFLRQQGINQIDLAIALTTESSLSEGWSEIAANLAIKGFFQPSQTEESFPIGEESIILSPGQKIAVVSTALELIRAQPPILQLELQDRKWWLVGENKAKGRDLEQIAVNFLPHVIVASGKSWQSPWLNELTPQVAIATSSRLENHIQQRLEQKQVQLYSTRRDGAIQWLPKVGFQKILDTIEPDIF
jgi:competence protein ComEC